MLAYTLIMLGVGALFGVLAVMIARGRTDLIHDYHQQRVSDPAGYGKAFGKAMGLLAATMVLSGILNLVLGAVWAISVLAVGLIAGIVCLVAVQKKYNGGMF